MSTTAAATSTSTNGARKLRRLTPLNATVTTATVTIKTLTIDRRQVTLATFRQVPERDIFDHEANLNGVPWGIVNYCPGKGNCDAPIVTRTEEVEVYAPRADGFQPLPRLQTKVFREVVEHDHLLWQDGATLFRCPFLYPAVWMRHCCYDLEYERSDAERAVVEERYRQHAAAFGALDQLYIAT